MIHTDAHDPTVMHNECGICEVALRRALNKLADLPLGPRDADMLMSKLRELADEREEDHALARHLEAL